METSFCAGIFGNSGSPPATVGAATDGGLNGMTSRFSGVSAAFKRALQQVGQVGPTDATVLITGETGTGKELIARRLHVVSARRQRPLAVVNCAALPASLVESELFGHERGRSRGVNLDETQQPRDFAESCESRNCAIMRA